MDADELRDRLIIFGILLNVGSAIYSLFALTIMHSLLFFAVASYLTYVLIKNNAESTPNE